MHKVRLMLGLLALGAAVPAVAGIDVVGLELRRLILPQGGSPSTGSDVFAELTPGSTVSSGFTSTPSGSRSLFAFGDPARATDCCFMGSRAFGRYSVFAATNSGSVFDAFNYTLYPTVG